MLIKANIITYICIYNSMYHVLLLFFVTNLLENIVFSIEIMLYFSMETEEIEEIVSHDLIKDCFLATPLRAYHWLMLRQANSSRG
jgi:hypothetical protein